MVNEDSAPALPDVHHVGIVVADCLAAATRLSQLAGTVAMEPFVDSYDSILVDGVPTPFSLRLSFVSLGNVLVELLEPLDEVSPHAAYLDAHGDALHHLAFRVSDLTDQLIRLEGLGCRRLIDACVDPEASHWVYLSNPDEPGPIIELMQISAPNDAFFARVTAALTATGGRPR